MRKAIAVLVLALVALGGCVCPPEGWEGPYPPWCGSEDAAGGSAMQQPAAGQGAGTVRVGYLDDLGCFPEGCDLPPGMKELCENFEKGTISWPASCLDFRGNECRQLCERERNKLLEPVTFRVTVPENSPAGTSPLIQVLPIPNYSSLYLMEKMKKVGELTWEIEVRPEREKVHYRYFRADFGEAVQEELPNDLDGYREITIKPGDVVEDTVSNWRWFLQPGEELPGIESAAEETEIAPRAGDEKFQRGQLFPDFWWDSCGDLVGTTDKEIMESNANWAGIWPAWDYIETTPLPKIGYEGYGHVHDPSELDFHVSTVQNDGLNVWMGPQLCCHNPDSTKKYSDAWWEAWFGEIEKFSVYYAEAAEKHNIKYLTMHEELMWRNPNAPADIKERYAEHIAAIRKIYTGKLGFPFQTGYEYSKPEVIYPSGEDLEIFNPKQFDFFSVAIWTKVADGREPTIEEMEGNFREIFRKGIRPLYEDYGKPIIISASYPSVDGGASLGLDWNTYGVQIWDPYTDDYELDLEEQAMVYEALMRVVAGEDYVMGVYPFVYGWVELPKSKSWEIRGKPAEDVVAEWYRRFAEGGV